MNFIILSVIFICFLSSLIYIVIPYLLSLFIRRRRLSALGKGKYSCLTFDDGPNPDLTPDLLELFKKKGVKATFFVLGENVKKYPQLAAKIVEHGHEIGEHSYSHAHPWKRNPFNQALDLINGGRAIKRYISSGNSQWFRPPYGKLNLITLLYVLLSRKKLAPWDIDTRDYQEHSSEKLA
ncbi:MAG: polysaccharide deacetylase family protein, partial [Candidatus Sifarchaeia archaeon]